MMSRVDPPVDGANVESAAPYLRGICFYRDVSSVTDMYDMFSCA